jgi:hypothetical protein
MSNTLAELHQECERIGRRVTDAHLPLKMYGKSCAVELQLYGDNGNYWVEVRTTLDYDEKVAIIMQMFEDGTNDSIAMAVANRIKQGVIDKACEWLNTHSETDYFELIPDANYCGAGKLNKKKMIDDFRKAMED